MPDPPQEVIEQSLQNLSKQNPICKQLLFFFFFFGLLFIFKIIFLIIVAQNLQNIIFNQIKANQMGPEAQDFADCKLTIHYFIIIVFYLFFLLIFIENIYSNIEVTFIEQQSTTNYVAFSN